MNGNGDLTTSWLNFAQQPVDQGGLGLAPHQAAGLVGNLQNESGQGLTPWGVSGDNGTAQGTAQWRGDRLDALKHAFPDSYQTPQAQQAFMRQEFLGPENKAYQALQAAGSPEEAASAVNHLYERSADTSGNREKAAAQLMAQLGGGSGGALSFANDDEDGSTPAAAPAALSANSALGPGALQTIMPAVADDKKGYFQKGFGARLESAGAALAGISNPQQGYVLNSLAKQMRDKDAADDKTNYHVVATKDGRILRVDPSTGQVDQIGGGSGGAANPMAGFPQMIPKWGDASVLGADPTKATPDQQTAFIKSMPDSQGAMVQAILENRLPPPTSAAYYKKESPYPAAFAAAAKLDPTVDPATYSGRVAGFKDWATKGAESARALNQTISHQSDALVGAMKGLNNYDTPLLNTGKNWWSENVSGSGAVPGFRTSAHAVVDELGKVFKQNNLSDTEIRKWEENLPTNMSPAQERTQIATFHTLMSGAMSALENKRKQAIGSWAAAKQPPLLSDEGRAGLQKLEDFSKDPAAAAPNSAVAPINHDAIDAEIKRRGL